MTGISHVSVLHSTHVNVSEAPLSANSNTQKSIYTFTQFYIFNL